MCLAIPGKILYIDESVTQLKMAKVDFGGVFKNICVEWVDVREGDYILAHAGVALTKVDTEAALQSIDTFERIVEKMDAYKTAESDV